MLSFIEAGTNQAAEYGCEGNDIDPLASTLGEVEKLIVGLPPAAGKRAVERVWGIVERAGAFGWGFSDYATQVAAGLSDQVDCWDTEDTEET